MTPLRTLALAAAALALAPLVLVTTGTAQPPPGTVGDEPGSKSYEQREGGVVEIIRNSNGSISERILTPAEVAERREQGGMNTISAGHMVHGEAYTKPRRLAPGQSGTLKVMAFFAGSCVALPGNHIKLKLEPAEGLVFGQPVLQAAQKGTIEGKFQGKPVYDDFMLFDVPVQVSETVKPPTKIFLKGQLDLELHNGNSGARLGAFFAEVGGRVEIGKPLPESNVAVPIRANKGERKTAKTGKTGKQPTKTKSKPKVRPGGTSKADSTKTGTGTLENAGTESPGGPAEVDATDVLAADGGPDYLAWILGGAVAVILALLLLARRK